MAPKSILTASAGALALVLASAAFAEQPKTHWVSGDTSKQVGTSSETQAPVPNAQEQARTQKILNRDSELISGDYPNENGGEEARVSNPDPNAADQKATGRMLKEENNQSGAISGKYQ